MRWRRGAGEGQIEDRRGQSMGSLPRIGAAGGGLGLIGLLLMMFLGGGLPGGGGSGFDIPGLDGLGAMEPQATPGSAPPATDDEAQFLAFVMEDVQASWTAAFADAGKRYEPTRLVLFEQATSTACGLGSSETGPFYCPPDSFVYLDLSFFRELRSRFGAPGDFAQAYVIAHEVGHHVQNVLGINDDVRAAQQRNPDDANELSVRLELQADCFAGVWAHSAAADGLLEAGDLEEGLAAAAAVGDDRIQRETAGRVDPESWTHGSSEQRVSWFRRGFDGGQIEDCDPFD